MCAQASCSNRRDAHDARPDQHVAPHGRNNGRYPCANIAAYHHGESWLDECSLSAGEISTAPEHRGVEAGAPDGTYLSGVDFRALALRLEW